MSRNVVQVIARYWVVAFFFALVPFGLTAILAGVLTLPFLAGVALLGALGFNLAQWLGHRVLFGGTKEYEELRSIGKDAWFDVSCPWPFRPESEQDGLAAHDEPEVRWFCNNCHAEAHDLDAPCWACGYEQYECRVCGSPVRDQFASCNRCGNDPLG